MTLLWRMWRECLHTCFNEHTTTHQGLCHCLCQHHIRSQTADSCICHSGVGTDISLHICVWLAGCCDQNCHTHCTDSTQHIGSHQSWLCHHLDHSDFTNRGALLYTLQNGFFEKASPTILVSPQPIGKKSPPRLDFGDTIFYAVWFFGCMTPFCHVHLLSREAQISMCQGAVWLKHTPLSTIQRNQQSSLLSSLLLC